MKVLLDTSVLLWLLAEPSFDRLLVAQALESKLTLATADTTVQQYPVPLLYC